MCITSGVGVAQQTADQYRDSVLLAGDRSRALQLEELQDIEFLGCQQISEIELLGIISSRASDNSLGRILVEFYESTMRRNGSKPALVYRRLADLRTSYEADRRFYDPGLAKEDSAAIIVYLNQQGYHNATVTYGFGYVAEQRKKVLRFLVNEGKRTLIDTMVIRGLESIEPTFRDKIIGQVETRAGSPFSENALEKDLGIVIRELRNNGYYQASYQPRPFR